MIRKILLIAAIFIGIPAGGGSQAGDAGRDNEQYVNIIVAQELASYYSKKYWKADPKVVWAVIDEAEKLLPVYFPDGAISMSDVLTIASCESGFYPKAVGPMGEVGIFQVYRPAQALRELGYTNPTKEDYFDVRTNTRMGLWILRQKYEAHKDRKKAIIAYNGVVKTRTGWDEKYWRYFSSRNSQLLPVIEEARRRATQLNPPS